MIFGNLIFVSGQAGRDPATDIKEFPKMNEVYARAFGSHRPARTTVQVAGLPGAGLLVEIDAVAYVP
jgi:2-iminobutanoate/2-iminopropanoate deaminase